PLPKIQAPKPREAPKLDQRVSGSKTDVFKRRLRWSDFGLPYNTALPTARLPFKVLQGSMYTNNDALIVDLIDRLPDEAYGQMRAIVEGFINQAKSIKGVEKVIFKVHPHNKDIAEAMEKVFGPGREFDCRILYEFKVLEKSAALPSS